MPTCRARAMPAGPNGAAPSQRACAVRRVLGGALCICLAACGGGGAADSAAAAPPPAKTAAASAQAMVRGPTPLPARKPDLPFVCAGLNIRIYAQVSAPMKLSFGPDGALYAGRQGGNRIHRIAPGGGSVAEFGPPMVDPDAVLVDAGGRISGVPNALLVGGAGILAAIFPDQSSSVIFSAGFADVNDIKFDRAQRLVFSDNLPQVLVSKGRPPAVLFSTPGRPGSLAVDDHNRIYVALADGTIRMYGADGSMADHPFASGLAGLDTYLAFGSGRGGFGNALYVLNGSDLLRFDQRGRATLVGSGFGIGPTSGTGFVFGPDDALYLSDYQKNRVLRIARGPGGLEQCQRR